MSLSGPSANFGTVIIQKLIEKGFKQQTTKLNRYEAWDLLGFFVQHSIHHLYMNRRRGCRL
jgi:hypothetical protein